MRMESCHYLLAGVVLLVLTSCPFCHTWLFSDEQTTPAGTDLIKALWALNVTINPPSSSVEREHLRSSLDWFIRFLECVCKSAGQACFNDFQKTQSSLKHTNHTNAIYSSSLSVLSSCYTALSQRWIFCEENEASVTFRKYTNCAKSVSASLGCIPIYALMNIDSNQYFEVYTENREINVALCQGQLSIGESEIQLYTDKSTATEVATPKHESKENKSENNIVAIIVTPIAFIVGFIAIAMIPVILGRRALRKRPPVKVKTRTANTNHIGSTSGVENAQYVNELCEGADSGKARAAMSSSSTNHIGSTSGVENAQYMNELCEVADSGKARAAMSSSSTNHIGSTSGVENAEYVNELREVQHSGKARAATSLTSSPNTNHAGSISGVENAKYVNELWVVPDTNLCTDLDANSIKCMEGINNVNYYENTID